MPLGSFIFLLLLFFWFDCMVALSFFLCPFLRGSQLAVLGWEDVGMDGGDRETGKGKGKGNGIGMR